MKLIGGNPIWSKINKTHQRYNPLKDNIFCDLLIVGGGITGAICAYYLSQAGMKCVLIEENLIAQSSTSACTAILQYEIDSDILGLANRIGEGNAKRSFVLCKESLYELSDIINKNDIDCSYIEVPSLYYTNSNQDFSHMKKEFDIRKELGFDVDFLYKDNYEGYEPFPISSGILSNSGSATIDPYLFTIDLINLCNTKGVKVFEKTKIKDKINLDEGLVCTTTNNFNITCKKIVMCTGYRCSSLFKEPVASFTRSFSIVTSPITYINELWYKNMIMRDKKDYSTYIRVTHDNRIIISGENIATLSYDENKNNNAYNTLESNLKKLFPDIDGYNIDYKFNGIFADTKDSLPYIGEHPDFKDHYFCLSYGSNGILYAIIGAQLIERLYNKEYSPDLELFKFRRS